MFYPIVEKNQNTTEYIRQFLGYNHNPVISDGEMYDMRNLTSDHYPLLSPRKKRSLNLTIGNSEWNEVPLTFESEAVSDVSKAYAVYTSDPITVSGRENYQLSLSYDESVMSHAKMEIFVDNKSSLKETVMNGSIEYEFYTEKSDSAFYLQIVAYAGDVTKFHPEDVDSYISTELKKQENRVRGILCKDDKLAYIIDQTLYYDGENYDISPYLPEDDDRESDLQIISYNAYILVFPVGIYLNTLDTEDIGNLGAKVSEAGSVTYTVCRADGTSNGAIASNTPPSNPNDGDYWLNSETKGLYLWYGSLGTWQAVPSTYVMIHITGEILSDYFSEGDAVFMNSKFEDINNGSVIEAVGEDYIIVTGIIDKASETEVFDEESPFIIERRIPQLDYVCVSQNRIWGCFRGESDGEILNEIRASKLGDPKNWYSFEGLSTDAYTVSIGSDGDFTGGVSYQGYPMFFKENAAYRVYGSYPSAYQLIIYDCRGVQKGSEKSLCVIGEYLMYKSIKEFCIWDGGTPTGVSDALGKGTFTDAVSGVALNKYYTSVTDADGNRNLFAYDLSKGMWHKEDDLNIEQFSYSINGQLYGKNGLNIYGFGLASEDLNLDQGDAEEHVFWSATLAKQYATRTTQYNTYTSIEKIRPGKMTIRADIPYQSELSVFLSCDDGEFEKIITLRGEDFEYGQEFQLKPIRCDHFQIRLEGRDDCKVYLIHVQFDIGSERK